MKEKDITKEKIEKIKEKVELVYNYITTKSYFEETEIVPDKVTECLLDAIVELEKLEQLL